jgi:hypothetical protein
VPGYFNLIAHPCDPSRRAKFEYTLYCIILSTELGQRPNVFVLSYRILRRLVRNASTEK